MGGGAIAGAGEHGTDGADRGEAERLGPIERPAHDQPHGENQPGAAELFPENEEPRGVVACAGRFERDAEKAVNERRSQGEADAGMPGVCGQRQESAGKKSGTRTGADEVRTQRNARPPGARPASRER